MPLWWVTKDGDTDCLELFERHYSARRRDLRRIEQFVGPGNKLVLRIGYGDAMFVWRKFVDDADDGTGKPQEGINCAVFRNETQHLSSRLIREADAIADEAWTDRRHYTYVDPEEIRSRNPGACFKHAGWRTCGRTKGGLVILERIADAARTPIQPAHQQVGDGQSGTAAELK